MLSKIGSHFVELFEASGAVILGVPALLLAYKKISAKSAVVDTSEKAAVAQTEVIELLRVELGIFGKMNASLAKELSELQSKNMELRREISGLHSSINKVNEELRLLRDFSCEHCSEQKEKIKNKG